MMIPTTTGPIQVVSSSSSFQNTLQQQHHSLGTTTTTTRNNCKTKYHIPMSTIHEITTTTPSSLSTTTTNSTYRSIIRLRVIGFVTIYCVCTTLYYYHTNNYNNNYDFFGKFQWVSNTNTIRRSTTTTATIVTNTDTTNTPPSTQPSSFETRMILNGHETNKNNDDINHNKKKQQQDQEQEQLLLLYQQAIQHNSNVSHYQSYHEIYHRSYRFPSIEERLKVYMSTWYIPPPSTCMVHNDTEHPYDDDDSSRIQYNYITINHTTNNNEIQQQLPMILIQPSIQRSFITTDDDNTSLTTSSSDDYNTTIKIMLLLDTIPTLSRVPFVYHIQQIQSCTDKFCYDTMKYFHPSIQRLVLSSSIQQQQEQLNITTTNMSTTTTTITTPTNTTPLLLQQQQLSLSSIPPIILQFGDAEQYQLYDAATSIIHNNNDHMDDINQKKTKGGKQQKPKYIYRPNIPIIKKFRYSMDAQELHRVTSVSSSNTNDDCSTTKSLLLKQQQQQQIRFAQTIRYDENLVTSSLSQDQNNNNNNIHSKIVRLGQPIISIVSNYERHFNPINDIHTVDIPWEEKINMAIYRGALTGKNRMTTHHHHHQTPENSIINSNQTNMIHPLSHEEEMDEIEWCQEVPRCNLVYRVGHSHLVNAKLVAIPKKPYPVLPILNNISMFGNSLSFLEMLQYKAIIILEGNDVATGLKWSLFSNSVVMMPKPTCTSWAMEELLQPYVHYIPLYDNLTNIEEQVVWMNNNDALAQQIAYNGKLWILDLVFHPDAEKENEYIIDETFRRYMLHFKYNPNLQI